ncbi:MAG: hypothetical protein K9J83_05380 [Desulfarculaceae bacterium]|nr:hypothetical protein [Desulfarculaceae bacterium]
MKESAHKVRCFVSGCPDPLTRKSALWNMPLEPVLPDPPFQQVSVGEYLEAAEEFVLQDHCNILIRGISFTLADRILPEDIFRISLFLEKHGAFYHPIRVQVDVKESCLEFVLNGAVNHEGILLVDKEYRCLKKLGREHGTLWLPKVFGCGTVRSRKAESAFFIAQWFTGYKEFHICGSPFQGQVDIWDGNGEETVVCAPRSYALYRGAAEILTELYNPETFEQVFPWHHASGDFVVRPEDLDVKLITVRGYAPLFRVRLPPAFHEVLVGLLFFLCLMTLRMRLDRINGTGEYTLMQDGVMLPVLNGFFNALRRKRPVRFPDEDLFSSFVEFFHEITPDRIEGILHALLDASDARAPEIGLLKSAVHSHSHQLSDEFVKGTAGSNPVSFSGSD